MFSLFGVSQFHYGKDSSRFNKPSGITSASICKASGKRATEKCTDTYQEIFVEGTVPGLCDAHENSADVCSESNLLANEFCPDVVTKYYSYVVEKERLKLWKNLNSESTEEPPLTHCTIHTAPAVDTQKAPTLTLNGDSSMTLNVGDKYIEKGANAKDDIDGDLTNKISISGSVNTSKAGTYTVTYSVKNSRDKTTTIKRTITVKDKSKPANNTNTNTTKPENTVEPKNETPAQNTSGNNSGTENTDKPAENTTNPTNENP